MKAKSLRQLAVGILILVMGLGLFLYPSMTDLAYKVSQAVVSQPQDPEGQDLPDGAVATLSIPKIELETTVVSGTTQKALKKGPGHYEETPLPGDRGNSAIAGHRTMYGHPFRNLDQLEAGDEIVVRTESGGFTYRVLEKKIVRPTDLSVIDPTEDSRLTLTTCHPVGSARERLIVVAELDRV